MSYFLVLKGNKNILLALGFIFHIFIFSASNAWLPVPVTHPLVVLSFFGALLAQASISDVAEKAFGRAPSVKNHLFFFFFLWVAALVWRWFLLKPLTSFQNAEESFLTWFGGMLSVPPGMENSLGIFTPAAGGWNLGKGFFCVSALTIAPFAAAVWWGRAASFFAFGWAAFSGGMVLLSGWLLPQGFTFFWMLIFLTIAGKLMDQQGDSPRVWWAYVLWLSGTAACGWGAWAAATVLSLFVFFRPEGARRWFLFEKPHQLGAVGVLAATGIFLGMKTPEHFFSDFGDPFLLLEKTLVVTRFLPGSEKAVALFGPIGLFGVTWGFWLLLKEKTFYWKARAFFFSAVAAALGAFAGGKGDFVWFWCLFFPFCLLALARAGAACAQRFSFLQGVRRVVLFAALSAFLSTPGFRGRLMEDPRLPFLWVERVWQSLERLGVSRGALFFASFEKHPAPVWAKAKVLPDAERVVIHLGPAVWPYLTPEGKRMKKPDFRKRFEEVALPLWDAKERAFTRLPEADEAARAAVGSLLSPPVFRHAWLLVFPETDAEKLAWRLLARADALAEAGRLQEARGLCLRLAEGKGRPFFKALCLFRAADAAAALGDREAVLHSYAEMFKNGFAFSFLVQEMRRWKKAPNNP